jgi:cytochrome c553
MNDMTQLFRRVLLPLLGLMAAFPVLGWDEEREAAMALKPNLDNGRRVYEACAICHTPMGWGMQHGRYPQISGQHPHVTIKQLTDIRQGNRDNPTMYPFAQISTLGGVQNIADVAAYIARLPMSPYNSVGPGRDLDHGAALYKEHCKKCHGANGEGNNKDFQPRIQGQHFEYLLRQFQWIKSGRRRNADQTMVKQIKGFGDRDIVAVVDYVSRLRPPKAMTVPPGWRNPDFPPDFTHVPPIAPQDAGRVE